MFLGKARREIAKGRSEVKKRTARGSSAGLAGSSIRRTTKKQPFLLAEGEEVGQSTARQKIQQVAKKQKLK